MAVQVHYPASAPTMPDSFWQELAEENPLGSTKITPRDVKDWYYFLAWLRYKTYPYGRSRREETHKNKIARWWANVDGNALREARHIRAVREGRARPLMHRPRVGSRELPQEPRGVGEMQKAERLRLVRSA